MNLRKEFFSNNFVSFLIENELFFKKYKKVCVKIIKEYIKKLSSSRFEPKNEEISKFYDTLFLRPFFTKEKVDPSRELSLIYKLNDYDIDSSYILNKTFLMMSNSYIKYLIKEKNPILKLKNLALLLNFYIKYIEFHINIEAESSAPIPEEIKLIYDTKKPLHLFTVYKGIPIAHKTQILSVDEKEGVIQVTANSYQIVAAKFQKEIFLLENDKKYSFRANIQHFIIHKKIMFLNNIEKVKRTAPKRNFIRVQPKEKIKVTLKKGTKKVITELYDISLRGLCVLGEKLDLHISDIITLEFILHLEKPHFIITEGEIKSITKLDENTYRYHIHFEVSTQDEYILSKYITKREKEIVKELNTYISKEFIVLSS
ncbi:PilZ domain-containing protein [Nautilia sp.]